MRTRLSILFVVASLAALALLPSATATTAPAVQVTIGVNVNDSGIKMTRYKARRGWAVHFVVRNTGSKPYAVDIGGLLTGPIAPGKKKTVSASLEERGRYPFKVLVPTPSKQHVGIFQVF
jgi:hypothetical protein